MPFLLREIKHFSKHAAGVLEDAELRIDSEILALTREDLCDLFPGPVHFKLRRTLFDMIHKQPIAVEILNKLKGFLPRDSLRAALSDNGVLVDYRQYLKDTKTQMNHVQSFLDAHIDLLEEFSADQPDSGRTDGRSQESGEHRSGPSASAAGDPVELYGDQRDVFPRGLGTSDAIGRNVKHIGPSGVHPQEPQKHRSGPSASAAGDPVELHGHQRDVFPQDAGATLLYKMVVAGKTFGTHLKLMLAVEKPFLNRLRVCGYLQDNKITFVFCPISSRIGADVDAAMVDIKDDKPIILVLMHHTHEVRPVTSMKIRPDDDKVVLRVNVFYHDTCGLLKCEENDAAVTEIQNKLWKSFIPRSNDSGGNSQGRGADGNSNK